MSVWDSSQICFASSSSRVSLGERLATVRRQFIQIDTTVPSGISRWMNLGIPSNIHPQLAVWPTSMAEAIEGHPGRE